MILKSRKIKLFAVVILFGAIVFSLNRFQNSIKPFFYTVSASSQKMLWQTGQNCSNFFSSIFNTKRLKDENNNLTSKNQELLARIADLESLEKENNDLRNALGIGLEKEFSILSAEITAKDISQDFITINKGSLDGLRKNMPVITGQKVLVGRISEVYKNFSKVMLASNKKIAFDAKIERSDTTGIIKGMGNFSILFDLLPQDKNISKEDAVISSNMGGIFPSGLLVGKIKSVKKNDIESFQQAEIDPSFDINKAGNVFVILNFI